jgi:diguanylate cyclase (GGDEF)-like protein
VKRNRGKVDEILTHVATTLKSNFRDTDFVARCERDTFAVILPEAKNESAVNAAERVRKAVERAPLVTAGGTRRRATVSVGVVTYPGSAENLNTLLEQATKALARAQQLGPSQVVTL